MSTTSLEARLARLESSARRWRFAAVSLGLAFILVTGLGFADDAKALKNVRTHRLTIVDPKGNDRILLSAEGDEGMAVIHITDSKQKRAVSIRVNDEMASVGCFDDNARERVKSSTSAKGAGTFYMDTNQKPRLVVATTEAGAVVFMKLGEDGKPIAE